MAGSTKGSIKMTRKKVMALLNGNFVLTQLGLIAVNIKATGRMANNTARAISSTQPPMSGKRVSGTTGNVSAGLTQTQIIKII
jgi:hypothetical protein